MALWNAEFSLALHNRTGKFHIGQAILQDQANHIDKVFYWRHATRAIPTGIAAKVLGRLVTLDIKVQGSSVGRILPAMKTARPMLHFDPFTVAFHQLSSEDLVLCHDMGPITHPHLFGADVVTLYKRAYAKIAQAKPGMIFVSRSSQTAFEELYGDWGRSTVIYPSIRPDIARPDAVAPSALPDQSAPFLLTVGSLGLRKNQVETIRAFAETGLAQQGMRYVLCGSSEPGAEVVRAAASETEGVHVMPYVTDAELSWLYRNASGFVLLSQLEGFGIPVAEAIASDLVPLVSRASVLEEVAGPAAITADPNERASMSAALKELVALGADEKASRQQRLQASISRFTPASFAAGWSEVLGRS